MQSYRQGTRLERKRRFASTNDWAPPPQLQQTHTTPKSQAAGFSAKLINAGRPRGKGCRKNFRVDGKQTSLVLNPSLRLLSSFSHWQLQAPLLACQVSSACPHAPPGPELPSLPQKEGVGGDSRNRTQFRHILNKIFTKA